MSPEERLQWNERMRKKNQEEMERKNQEELDRKIRDAKRVLDNPMTKPETGVQRLGRMKMKKRDYLHEEWDTNPYEPAFIPVDNMPELIDMALDMHDEMWFDRLTQALKSSKRRGDDLVGLR